MHTEKYSFKGEIAEWREELRRADQDKQIDVLKKGALFLTESSKIMWRIALIVIAAMTAVSYTHLRAHET